MVPYRSPDPDLSGFQLMACAAIAFRALRVGRHALQFVA